MEFDDVYKYTGHLSRYQFAIYCCLGFSTFLLGLQNFSSPFTAMEQKHWCQVERLSNLPYDDQKNLAIPWDSSKEDYDSCKMFDFDWYNMTDDQIKDLNRSEVESSPVIKCDKWVHDNVEFKSTIITENIVISVTFILDSELEAFHNGNQWELTCSRSWMVQFAGSIYVFGLVLGSLVCGPVADRFGRKTCMMIFLVMAIPAGFGAAFSPYYSLYIGLRCVVALCSIAAFTSGFVLSMEIIGPKYRTIAGISFQNFFACGYMLSPGIAVAIKHFRWFLAILSAPYLIALFLTWLVPESPRWLLSVGKKEKALRIIANMAKHNKERLPPDFLQHQNTESGQSQGHSQLPIACLFKHPLLRRYLITNLFQWTSISVIYWAIGLNIGSLVGDIYLNGFLMGFIEVPAHIISFLLMGVIGRRWMLAGSLLLCALSSLITVPFAFSKDLQWVVTTMSLIGKGAVTAAFAVVYVYSAEVFPTSLRQVALGTASTLAKVGSMGSPYMGGPLQSLWLPLPSVVFGSLSAVAGVMSVLLPETKDWPLPDTLEDVEKRATKSKREDPKSATTTSVSESDIPAPDKRTVQYNEGFEMERF